MIILCHAQVNANSYYPIYTISARILGDGVRLGKVLKLPTWLMTTTEKEVELTVAGDLYSNAQIQLVTGLFSAVLYLLWEGQSFRTPNISRAAETTGLLRFQISNFNGYYQKYFKMINMFFGRWMICQILL